MKHRLVLLSVVLLVACGGGVGEEYAEIVPTIYMAGGSCAWRLSDELDGAPTKTLFADDRFNGLLALGVCARVRESDEWVVVEGQGLADGGFFSTITLGVENITGEARVLPRTPPNASATADANASLEAVAVGHVRVNAWFGGMEGSGVIEIVAE